VPAERGRDRVARVRTALAEQLRSRVAGDDAAEHARRIWGAEGERWFTPEDPVWRVHADASMFVGGIRALLLQSLHPLAMAGVAGHSGYRADPWGRLQRTSHYLATTTFGTVDDAEAAIDAVRAVHARVRGRAGDGRPYSADDPHLLTWVHLAEVDSFLETYRRHGPERLDPAEEDLYVEQAGVAAARLGVPDPPRSVAELAEGLRGYRPELVATPAARDAARFLLLQPPLPLAARPGYGALAAAAVASLPVWARRHLRLPVLPVTERVVVRALGDAATGVVRWAMGAPAVATDRRSAS
jgi:uncharacterized protein (DUF2236 family)